MSTEIRLPPKWIELNVNKRECSTFLPVSEDDRLCQCGKLKAEHSIDVLITRPRATEPWLSSTHTRLSPTDAHGTLVFEGEHYPNKAHYVRLSHDTNPETVIQMMALVWGLPMPKLLITVRGGNNNFEIPSRLGKILQLGLIKAAKSTGAWIITNGLNRGVAKHVGGALGNQRLLGVTRGRVVSIGIAPWGLVEQKEALVGRNKERVYNPLEHPTSKFVMLNPRHANFLLVDNGSTGKVGGESLFRRRLEKCISSYATSPHRGCDTPVVCVVIEGGFNTLRTIAEYLNDDPPTPVVIFSGTGRTADLITLVLKRMTSGVDLEDTKEEVCDWMVRLYATTLAQSAMLFQEVRRIVARRNLLTVFTPRSTEGEGFDRILLASIFRSQHWTPLQQLSLTLVWDRVDIATNEVFVYGRDWSREHLEHAMMEALVSDRLNFVSLLIEHGLNMQTFLTPARLEALYSLEHTTSWVMKTLLRELAKIRDNHRKFQGRGLGERDMSLHDVGFVMSHMMGHVYKSRYYHLSGRPRPADEPMSQSPNIFPQPFDDLFIWAVLTKRHKMGVLLWRHGTGALAKALVAVKLNKYLAEELASTEKTETNMAAEFESYATEWESLSLDLLDMCFKADSKMARQLLTMELESWSKQTCLTLAVIANHRMLLGHPCSQILLADLWMGALNLTRNTTIKVLLGVILVPLALCWDYKTTEELKLLPHQGHVVPSSRQELMDTEDRASIRTFTRSRASVRSSVFFRPLNKTSDPPPPPPVDQASLGPQLLYQREEAKPSPHTHRVTIEEPPPSSESEDGAGIRAAPNRARKDDSRKGKGREKGVGGGHSFVTTRQELKIWRKLYEFQKAPVTNFYRHMLGYITFLCLFAYMILVPRSRDRLGYVEIYVISYLGSLASETMREFVCIDAYSWSQKWAEFRTNIWLIADFMVVGVFMVGVGLRSYDTPEPILFKYGVLIYKVTSIYWNLRLYKYMSVHRFVGPKIVMMSRMLKHMTYFAMIILVVLIAFGISRESIRFPDVAPTWKNIAEAFLEPYIMFYGEIDIDSLSPQCGEAEQPECPVGHWIIPLTWTIYMMVANILIVNVLIAVFNGIYSEVDAIAVELWMFQRFQFVMEFEQKPLLPPPFIILAHVYYLLRWSWRKVVTCLCESESEEEGLDFEDAHNLIMGNDHSLKTFLSPAEVNRAFDFEEEHVDNINLALTEYDEGLNALRKTMFPSPLTEIGKGGGGAWNRGPNPALELLELENKGLAEVKSKLADVSSEMESQRLRLDRILSLMEDDMALGSPDSIHD